jgi:hypothetical protein
MIVYRLVHPWHSSTAFSGTVSMACSLPFPAISCAYHAMHGQRKDLKELMKVASLWLAACMRDGLQ